MRIPGSSLGRSRSMFFGVGIAVGLVAASVGLTAAAGTPKTYSACLSSKLGVMYNVAIGTQPLAKCVGSDVTISWNEQGPQGPAGLQGPSGAPGAQGPAGPSGAPGVGGDVTAASVFLNAHVCTGSDLSGISFHGVMPLAVVSNCSFANADFSGATIVMLGGLSTAPMYWALARADLSGANLSRTVFDGSGVEMDLRGATVTGASFKSVDWGEGIQATGVDFSGDDLDGSMVWVGTMANARFVAANLRNVAWNNIDLSGADFTGADLTGSSLTGSTLTGAIWDNTTCPNGHKSTEYNPQTCVGH